ncbi:MAG: oligoendopeptidase F, partial [Anaerolineae bacterium]
MTYPSYRAGRWSLEDLLPAATGPELQAYLEELEAAVADLESSREALSAGMPRDDFARLVNLVERIAAISGRLSAFGFLWYSEDTQDEQALAFRGRIEQLLTDVQNRTLFFSLWWKALDDEAVGRLLPAAGKNVYYLESLRRY